MDYLSLPYFLVFFVRDVWTILFSRTVYLRRLLILNFFRKERNYFEKKNFKCVLFFLLFICIGYLLNQTLLLKRPDGVTPMQDLYQAPTDSVDVLCIGSSHMGMSLSAAAMWEQEGIAAYGLWGSIQPFWNSYYNLKEALRFQSPKLVILEVYAASFTDEYSDEARQYSNLGGMNPNFTKWEAVTVSAPRDRWSTLFLNYPSYHTRYLELTEDDVLLFWEYALKR